MTPIAPVQPCSEWTRALVVFSGRTDLAWLRLLKPGYRHCFVLLGSACGWVGVNAMAHHTQVMVLAASDGSDLAAHFRAQGLTVVETVPEIPSRHFAGWRPYSCVEEAKRVLGMRAPLVLTPWQLHCRLTQNGKYSLTADGKPSTLHSVTATAMTIFRRLRGRWCGHGDGCEQNMNFNSEKETAMGGFFAPEPPAPAPAPPPSPAVADPEAEAAAARQESIARNRRGMMSTIATSGSGVLQPTGTAAGKSLLGE